MNCIVAATLATARFRLATAATRIKASRTRPPRSGSPAVGPGDLEEPTTVGSLTGAAFRCGSERDQVRGVEPIVREHDAPDVPDGVAERDRPAVLEERDGRYTGFMSSPPLVGEARAAWLRRYALQEGIDLKHSYAYADSYSDLPLLRAVGNPVAVSPDSALYRYARRRRWPIEPWVMSKGMPRVRFPKPAMR